MAGERMQVTLVQPAAQAQVAYKASKIGVNRILVPKNMLDGIGIYGNFGEVSICAERNLSLWNYDPSLK
jgi:hypothetical protein